MEIPNTITDYQTSLDILREQRQIRCEHFFSNPGLIMGLTVFILIVMATIITPAVASVDPNAMAIVDCLKGSSLKRPFGTNEFGRDLTIRTLYGARVPLLTGGTMALLSRALGTVIGIYVGCFKILDYVLIRICEGLIATSGMLLVTAPMAALGANNLNVIVALTIVYIPNVAQIMRSSALVTRKQPYVEAAEAQRTDSRRILRRLILPGVISPLTIQASFIFAQAIISKTSLSFPRAGVPAPVASWGNILQGSKQALQKASWTVILPGLAVVLCVLSLDLLEDGLRDYLDPCTAGGKK